MASILTEQEQDLLIKGRTMMIDMGLEPELTSELIAFGGKVGDGYIPRSYKDTARDIIDFLESFIDDGSDEYPTLRSLKAKLNSGKLFTRAMEGNKKSPKNTLKESFNDKENDFLRSRMEVEKAWGREKDGGVYYDEDYDIIESVLDKLENHEPLNDAELNWVKDYFEREKLWGREKDGGVYNDDDYDMMDNMIGQMDESSKVKKFLKEEKIYDFTSNDYGLTEDEFYFIFDQLDLMRDEGSVADGGPHIPENWNMIISILDKAESKGWKKWGFRHHDDD